MTFVVSDVHEQRWVLRRPPLHNVLATAHDMGREHRAIAALHPVGFPVPVRWGCAPIRTSTARPST